MKYSIFTRLKHLLVSFHTQCREEKFLFYFKKVIVCFFLFFITICLNVSAWRLFHSVIKIQLFPSQWKTLAIPFSPQSRTLSAITGSKRMISNRELHIVPISFFFEWSPRILLVCRAQSRDIEVITGRVAPYLQETMNYFVY